MGPGLFSGAFAVSVYPSFSNQPSAVKVEELKEKLWALAERRPADATKLLGQAFGGKKSLGEMASAPQTTDPNLKSAPPREFLNNTIVKDLTPALVQVYNKGSRRVVSDLGDMLVKGK